MKKQLLSLALLAAAWLTGGTAWAWDEPTQVDGVYQIGTVSEFNWFAVEVNNGNTSIYAVLIANLDFRDKDFVSIGTSTNRFVGHFNGQGHTISNLSFDKGSADDVGIFSYVTGGTSGNQTIIENLIIDATCSFKGGNRVGAVVGNARNGDDLIIRNCINKANITATGVGAAFVGAGQDSNYAKIMVSNCINTGNITGSRAVAIIGWNNKKDSYVKNCINIGDLNNTGTPGDDKWFLGSNRLIENCYDPNFTGSTSGWKGYNGSWETDNCVTSGELADTINSKAKEICFYQGTGDTNPIPFFAYTTFNNGYYELGNSDDVEWFAAMVAAGNTGINGKLTNSINYNEASHTPIGNDSHMYNGTFDGQGYEIQNLTITTGSNIGFFGYVKSGATIQNLIVSGSITGADHVGGICGAFIRDDSNQEAKITFTKCINKACVEGTAGAASGISGAGVNPQAIIEISDCANYGTITTGSSYAAAICAWANNSNNVVKNCFNIGEITSANTSGNAGSLWAGNNRGGMVNNWDFSPVKSYSQNNRGETADLSSGKLCYLLNGDQSNIVWKQTLGTDDYPSPFGTEIVNYVGDAEYTTFYDATNDWALNGDAQAYIGTINGNYLHLEGIDDIPAGTAVVIGGTYYNKVSTTATATTTGNVLSGSDGTITGGDDIYALSTLGGTAEIGFYPVSDAITIPAGKAYLNTSTGVKGFTFVFDDDDATSLSSISSPEGKECIYNLAGQRIQKMQKGINIINGKKVLF